MVERMIPHMRKWWGYQVGWPKENRNTYNNIDIIGVASYQKYCQYVLDYFKISLYDIDKIILPQDIYDVHITSSVYSSIHSVNMNIWLYENDVKNNYLFIDSDFILDPSIDIGQFNLSCKYLFLGGGDGSVTQKEKIEKSISFEKCVSTNLLIDDNRYLPLPIGSRFGSYEDNILYRKTLEIPHVKTQSVYVNFQTQTGLERPSVLNKCTSIGLVNKCRWINFQTFINELGQHLFAVSPESNGIDSSRTWDALYTKTIPIVKKSILTTFYSKIFPMIVLNDWNELENYTFNFDLYKQIMEQYPNYEKYLDCKTLFNYIIQKCEGV